jgi:uncharacterized protein (UPF0332 family)
MVDRNVYLRKASESLAGTESEYVNGRHNNCANRCYYACFQTAISVLILVDVRPSHGAGQWGHEFGQSSFVGQIIDRRKVYPGDLRGTLFRNLNLRHVADCETNLITQTEAIRALRRTREFVEAVLAKAVEGKRP